MYLAGGGGKEDLIRVTESMPPFLPELGQVEKCSGGRGGKETMSAVDTGDMQIGHLLFQKAVLAAADWEEVPVVLPNLKFQNVDF